MKQLTYINWYHQTERTEQSVLGIICPILDSKAEFNGMDTGGYG